MAAMKFALVFLSLFLLLQAYNARSLHDISKKGSFERQLFQEAIIEMVTGEKGLRLPSSPSGVNIPLPPKVQATYSRGKSSPPPPKVAPSTGQATYGRGKSSPPPPKVAPSTGQATYGRGKSSPLPPKAAPSTGQGTYARVNPLPPLPPKVAPSTGQGTYGREASPPPPPNEAPTDQHTFYDGETYVFLKLRPSPNQELAQSLPKQSHLMVGSSRANEKGKAPAYANPNTHLSRGVIFLEEDDFDSILDMPPSIAGWEDIHRSVAQGVPEPVGNSRVYPVNTNSLQNPQSNPSSNTANTYFQEVPLLPYSNMGRGQQYMNQGHNAVSSGGISTFGGESSFVSSNRPQVHRNVAAPVHSRKTVNFNTNQSRGQGKFEGSFLSLGLGGTSEVSSSQLDCREISAKLKEAAPYELKIAHSRRATGQTFDDGFMGFQNNNSGFSNQFRHVSRMAPTKNEHSSQGSLNSGLGSSPHHILHMHQNDRQVGKADKLTKSASSELKMVRARKATGQTLDADFTSFQRNNSGFSNQFSNVDRATSTNYEIGVHNSKFNSEQGSSRNHALQMQHTDNRNTRSGDMDYNGNPVHSGTLDENLARFFNSQQHNLKPPEFVKPSWMTSDYIYSEQLQHVHSKTANSPNYAAPKVSWVGRGLAGTDAPFPKRLGVDLSVRNSPQNSQGHLSPMGRSLQRTNTDKGSTRMPHNVLRPIGQSDGAPVSYPMKYQEPFFTYGQSQSAQIQLPKVPQDAPFTNASTVDNQFQKSDFHVRRHHKRTAVVPHSASHWVQHQKKISRTQHAGSVAARIPPVIPCIPNVKRRVPVGSAPARSHITWKDPDATSKLSGYKCLLCKRDLALTSEGPVFQPSVPPPVAVLRCGHTFHDQCLQNITPGDQANDPPCIPCAIG
ncbi:hypothetical protein SSX86_010233 [Deinandra increscens subsp. villosa]|uniref:RING-type domain-containing protein n=1 Tax=Deinandra increscens subsp. villosa TaxID=3103831 RepID=A0AAP0H310_9ASTR